MSITKLNEAKKKKTNNDGNLANNYPPYDKVTRGDVIAGRLGKDQMGGKRKFTSESRKPNDGNLANNYPPYDKVTRGDVIAGALGQDQMGGKKKKKTVKEGYSNWREDLSEVIKVVNKDKNENKVTGKGVNNKPRIKINPSISEAVENLGGTLLEFVETENICILEDLKKLEILTLDDELLEDVVYEFFIESLEEGYSVDEIEFCILESIENSLSYLTEEEDSRKRGILGRIKGFVKGAAKKLARGVGYVAGVGVRAAKGTGREIASGYKRGRHGESGESRTRVTSSSSESPSTQRGIIVPPRVRATARVTSSSSESPSTETRVRNTARDGVRRGLRRTLSNWATYAAHKLDPDHDKPSAVHAKGPRSQKLRSGIGGGKRVEVAGRKRETEPEVQRVSVKEVPEKPSEVHSKKGTRKAQPYSTAVRTARVRTTPRLPGSSGESTSETKPSTPSPTPRRTRRPTPQTRTTTVTPTQTPTSPSTPTKKGGRRSQNKPNSNKQPSTGATTSSTGTNSQSSQSDLESKRRNATIEALKKNPNISKSKLQQISDSIKENYYSEYQLNEKSLSVSQQQAAGAALAAKRGEISSSELKGASLQMYNSMSEKQLRDFAKTKHKGLPEKKTKSEAVKEELIARMQAKIAEQALEITPKKPEKPQQEQKPQTSKISSALTAIEKASQAEMQKSRALRRLAQSGGDVSSVTK